MRFAYPLAQNFYHLVGRLADMDDHRQVKFTDQLQLPFQALYLFFFMKNAAMKIQTHFPKSHYFGMFGQFRNPYDIGFLYTRNFLWMDAYRGKNLWIFFCQCNRLFAGFDTGTGGNYPVHAGFNSTGNNGITITGKLIRIQMGMSIDNAHFRSVQLLFQIQIKTNLYLRSSLREKW